MGFMSNHSVRRTVAEQLVEVEFTGKPKKVSHNTVEYTRKDGTRVIRFHLTDIVEFLTDGSVRLNSGGFRTFTTKDRLNQYVPQGWRIWAEKGTWYVGKGNYQGIQTRYVFCDGITFHTDGTVTGSNPDEEQKNKELGKKILKYCRAMSKLPELPHPDGGDCWFCMMQTSDGRSLGEASKDAKHLISHLDENYFVGSLILRAMQWNNCTPMVISLAFTKDARNNIGKEYAVRSMRRYLRAQLGLSR